MIKNAFFFSTKGLFGSSNLLLSRMKDYHKEKLLERFSDFKLSLCLVKLVCIIIIVFS